MRDCAGAKLKRAELRTIVGTMRYSRVRELKMRKAFVSIAAFTILGLSGANAQSLKHCFASAQFDGWWRPAGDKTLYVRTNATHYYRLDLAQQCGLSAFPGAHLIFKLHGIDTICSRLDFGLWVSDSASDIPRPCFVKTISEVSPDEIAAIRNLKP
jgi:hypothetical protein